MLQTTSNRRVALTMMREFCIATQIWATQQRGTNLISVRSSRWELRPFRGVQADRRLPLCLRRKENFWQAVPVSSCTSPWIRFSRNLESIFEAYWASTTQLPRRSSRTVQQTGAHAICAFAQVPCRVLNLMSYRLSRCGYDRRCGNEGCER